MKQGPEEREERDDSAKSSNGNRWGASMRKIDGKKTVQSRNGLEEIRAAEDFREGKSDKKLLLTGGVSEIGGGH